jgi:hypothetical protein
MGEQRLGWLVDRLCRLSGEDDQIIKQAETYRGVAVEFAEIGLLVLVIFFLSVYSSVHFLVSLLGGLHVIATIIGFFWGAMVANIYYLLLFTITPPILRGQEHATHGKPGQKTVEKKGLARVSLFFRLLFVILLAVIIAQPWLVTIFDTSRWINQERQQYRAAFMRLANKASLSQDIAADVVRQEVMGHRVEVLLEANNFYTRRIQLINSRDPLSWVVTLIVVLFFVVPIGLKYRVRNKSDFYQQKKIYEEGVVLANYEEFKARYIDVFASRFGIDTKWYESCADPPFNTRKKSDLQEHVDQQDLLARIYHNEQEAEDNKFLIRETIS